MNRSILCIDLKSFYAFVECNKRGLNPYKTPLVVANIKQGNGSITLAITPYMKKLGIKSRSRLFEIPSNINYITASPRMSLYIEKSKEVIDIYLDFVSKDDLHVYSIDEAFLDVTDYLKYYNKNEYEIAKMILKNVKKKTGLDATCGIGPNLFLAKVALDTEAKNNKDNIAKWSYDDIQKKLWSITPLSKMWGIGFRIEKKLNNLGIITVGDLAVFDKDKLKKLYGVIGEELHEHANGIDESVISKHEYRSKSSTISNSQILFKDYYYNNVQLIIKEMLETLTYRLRNNNKMCGNIGLGITYSKDISDSFYRVLKLDTYTDDINHLFKYTLIILDKYIKDYPIRKVSISLGNLSNKCGFQLSLFDNNTLYEKNSKLNTSLDILKNKYNKNIVNNATSLLSDSTQIDRNNKIGGHWA